VCSSDLSLLFWAEGLAALAYGLIALLFLPRKAKKPEQPAAEEEAAAKPPRPGYRALLADRRYLVFLLAFLLLCIVYCQYTATLPLAVLRAGLSVWWYGAIVTLNAVIVVTCEVLATKFTQHWPLRLTQMSGFGLLAVGYGMYAIAMVPFFLVLGTVIWTLSEIIGAPTVYAYPGMVAPAHLRGRYFGAMQTMFGLGSAIGPVLGIDLFDHVGQRVWLWVSGVAVLALVIGRIGMRGKAAEPEPVAGPAPEPAG
jgi:predicted MFS family arabinose efflux permease